MIMLIEKMKKRSGTQTRTIYRYRFANCLRDCAGETQAAAFRLATAVCDIVTIGCISAYPQEFISASDLKLFEQAGIGKDIDA